MVQNNLRAQSLLTVPIGMAFIGVPDTDSPFIRISKESS